MLDILPSWVGCRQFFVSFPNDYITCRVNSVDLKNRLSDIETNCHDRLHVWLLRIVGASTAPTSMALPCRWRSRPQHQKRTYAAQKEKRAMGIVSSATDWPHVGSSRPNAPSHFISRSARICGSPAEQGSHS